MAGCRHHVKALALVLSMTLAVSVAAGTSTAFAGVEGAPNLVSFGYSYSPACLFQLVSVSVTNNGDADAAPFVVSYRVDHRHFAGSASYDETLHAGETTDVGPFPSIEVPRGAHLVEFLIDATRQVSESNELDNPVAFAFICY